MTGSPFEIVLQTWEENRMLLSMLLTKYLLFLFWPTSVAVKDGGRKGGGCGGEVEEPGAGAGGDDQQHPDVSAAGN